MRRVLPHVENRLFHDSSGTTEDQIKYS